MTTESIESKAEEAAVRHAVTRGYVQSGQLQEAVRQRDEARARGKPAQLMAILSTRFLSPAQTHEVHAVYRHHLTGSDVGSMAGPTDGRGGPGGTVQLPPRRPSDRLPAASPESPSRTQLEAPSEVGVAQSGADLTATLRKSGAGSGPLEAIGGYRIIKELARGGMGVVYVAQKKGLDRKVALKVLINADLAGVEDLERFRIEAEATARLSHEGIVTVYDVGQDKGRPFIVMELIEGESLKAQLLRDGPLPARKAAELGRKLALAMFYAHKRHILHRDLKPSNVLIGVDGEPKITDFGLAKDMRKSQSGERGLTMTGDVMGTPAYMPPEQATGELDQIDRRSDVYSLGATLYEMLTGRPPFEGSSPMRILSSVMVDDPTPPGMLRPNLDKDLETICLKCLEKRPEERYPSARALADDLGLFLAKRPIRARPPTVRERVDKWLQRNRGLAIGISVLLLLCGVGAVVAAYWLGGQQDRESAVRITAAAEASEQAKADMIAGAAEATRLALSELEEATGVDARLQAALGLLQAASRWDALANGSAEEPQDEAARQGAYMALEWLGGVAFEARQLSLATAAYQQLPEARAAPLLHSVEYVQRTIAHLEAAFSGGYAIADKVDAIADEIAGYPSAVLGPLLLERLREATEQVRSERDVLVLQNAARIGLDPRPAEEGLASEALRPVEKRILRLAAVDSLGRVLATFAAIKGSEAAFKNFSNMNSPGPRQVASVCLAALARMHPRAPLTAEEELARRTAALEYAEAYWDTRPQEHLLEALERFGARELYLEALQARIDGSYLAGSRPLVSLPAPPAQPERLPARRSVDEWLDRVRAAFAGSEDREALRLMDGALEEHPDQLELLGMKVELLAKLGDERGAISVCNHAVRVHPDAWKAYKLRAITRANQGDPRGALADLDVVLELHSSDLHSLMVRGMIRVGELGDSDGAKRDFQEFLRLAPADDARRERIEAELRRLR